MEKEKFLNVKIEAPEEKILRYLEKQIIKKDNRGTDAGLFRRVYHPGVSGDSAGKHLRLPGISLVAGAFPEGKASLCKRRHWWNDFPLRSRESGRGSSDV